MLRRRGGRKWEIRSEDQLLTLSRESMKCLEKNAQQEIKLTQQGSEEIGLCSLVPSAFFTGLNSILTNDLTQEEANHSERFA